jgi:hypothetical protein
MKETIRGRKVEAGLRLLCSADARRARGTRVDENEQHKTSAPAPRATRAFFLNSLVEDRFGRARDAFTQMVHFVLMCVLMCKVPVHVQMHVRVPIGPGIWDRRDRVTTAFMVICLR